MASFKMDPSKVADLLKKYRPEAALRSGHGGTQEYLFLCPFHPDSTPSFSFNVEKGTGMCFSCHATAHLSKLIAKFEDKSEAAVKKIVQSVVIEEEVADDGLSRRPGRPKKDRSIYKPCKISMEQVDAWHAALAGNTQRCTEFIRTSNVPKPVIDRFKIGFDGKAYTIPLIYNGMVINIKHYQPNGTPKYWGEEGANDNILWPLENAQTREEIWLFEGEKDCMLANTLGLNAVTFTGGSKSFAKEYLRFFKDKSVVICYDADDAGRDGADKLASILQKVAMQVKVIDLPEDKLPPKGDFTDYIMTAHGSVDELKQIAALTESHKGDNVTTKIDIPDEVHDTYLEQIIAKKLFFKRVRMRVRVASIATGKAYLVPRDIKASCPKDWKDANCMSCPMYFQDGGELEIIMRPIYPEILQVIDGNDKKQREALRSMLDIFPGCPKFKLECKTYQSIYPIVIIPALEKDKPFHSYTMNVAWALDLPAQPNEDYLCEAVIMANPDTQGLSIVVYKLEKDVSSADEFELDEEMAKNLEIFKCLPHESLNTNLPVSTTTSVLMSHTSTEDPTSTSPST